VPDIVSFISASMALAPGDLIFTGTPAGVGPVKPGETLTGGIDGVGEITIHIAP
jgi:fumarylpyruvate hydrolase